MVHVVIDITHPPFGRENTFSALYLATSSLSKGLDVTVLLRCDGVFTGLKGQIDTMENINLPPTENQIEDIIELDGRVVADTESLNLRGIEPNELISGIETVDTQTINKIILDHGDKTVCF